MGAADQARIDKGSPFVLVTPKGTPLRELGIANQWQRLLDRVCKDVPDFRRLSYKHLRKTAGQLVRKASDGETAGVFLSHGTPVQSDPLLDAYTNRDFSKVYAALKFVEASLLPVFATAPDAFTGVNQTDGSVISKDTIDKIHQLHKEGMPTEKIAKAVGVSRATAYRWVKRAS